MIANDLFLGRLVRLSAVEPEEMGKLWAGWRRESLYQRQLDSSYALLWSAKQMTAWLEEDATQVKPGHTRFQIRTLEDERVIGFVGLYSASRQHRDAWVGIGIGEPEYRGKGYGTDAMRVTLRYAFDELHLHRVTLDVFAFNTRAVRSYEKAGFKIEGRERGVGLRDGRRYDVLTMGILAEEFNNVGK